MLEYDIPSIITSYPEGNLPIPYLHPVIFDVTNKFVSKCEISFTSKLFFLRLNLQVTTSISARFSSIANEFFKNFSTSKLNSSCFLSNKESIPKIDFINTVY